MSDRRDYFRDYYRQHKTEIAKAKADRTKSDLDYRLRGVLGTIIQRCTDLRHKSWKWYGARGVKNFLTLEDLKILWHRDGAGEMRRPTIDRRESDGHYIFANCRFIEHADNLRKMVIEREARKHQRAA